MEPDGRAIDESVGRFFSFFLIVFLFFCFSGSPGPFRVFLSPRCTESFCLFVFFYSTIVETDCVGGGEKKRCKEMSVLFRFFLPYFANRCRPS